MRLFLAGATVNSQQVGHRPEPETWLGKKLAGLEYKIRTIDGHLWVTRRNTSS